MTTDFDELVKRLLEDVTHSGRKGFDVNDLENAIRAFYETKNRQQAQQTQSNGQHEGIDNDDIYLLPSGSLRATADFVKVDQDLVNAAWEWLGQHPDIQAETLTKPADPGRDSPEQPTPDTADPKFAEDGAESSDHETALITSKRIFPSKEKLWRYLTGHGPDRSLVSDLEFEILIVVAAYGAKGVLQPEVTHITAQDARSVPKRTDKLAEREYITKERVLSKGNLTSLLKLKKFASDGAARPSSSGSPVMRADQTHGSTALIQEGEQQPPEQQDGYHSKIIYYERWYDQMMRLLRENNNIITMEDLRIGLGFQGQKYERVQLARGIQRLVDHDAMRKIKAKVEDDGDEEGNENEKYVNSVQLLRQLTGEDRAIFIGGYIEARRFCKKKKESKKGRHSKVDKDNEVDLEQTADNAQNEEEVEEEGQEEEEDMAGAIEEASFEEQVSPHGSFDASYTPEATPSRKKRDAGKASNEKSRKRSLKGAEPIDSLDMHSERRTRKATREDNIDDQPVPSSTRTSAESSNPHFSIDPPGSKEMRFEHHNRPGRRPTAMIAVFRSDRLKDLPWFVEQSTHFMLPSKKRRSAGTEDLGDLEPGDDEYTEDTPSRKKKRVSGADVGSPLHLEGMRDNSRTAAIDNDKLLPPMPKSTAGTQDDSVAYTTASTPDPTPATTSLILSRSGARISSTVNLRAITLPKRKPGRPSKAAIEQREKLLARLEVLDGDSSAPEASLIVKLPLPDTMRPVTDFAGSSAREGVTTFDVSSVPEQSREHVLSRIVQLPVPRTMLTDDHVDDDSGAKTTDTGTAAESSFAAQAPPKVRSDSDHGDSDTQNDERYSQSRPQTPTIEDPATGEEDPVDSSQDDFIFPDESDSDEDYVDEEEQNDLNRDMNLPNRISGRSILGRDNTRTPNDTNFAPIELGDLPELISVDLENPGQKLHLKSTTKEATTEVALRTLRRKEIVMNIVKRVGGVFPSIQDMWYPFVDEWKKISKQQPDRKTVEHIVNLLAKEGELLKYKFSFQDKKGDPLERYIVTHACIRPTSEQAKRVQKAIIESYPYRYMPPEIELANDLRKKIFRGPMSTEQKRWVADNAPRDAHEITRRPYKRRSVDSSDWSVVPDVTVKRTMEGATARAENSAKKSMHATSAARLRGEKYAVKRKAESEPQVDKRRKCNTSRDVSSSFVQPRLPWYCRAESIAILHQSLTCPEQTFFGSSGTIGTKFSFLAERQQVSPKDVNDILQRTQLDNLRSASSEDWPQDRFYREIDRVSEWELDTVGENISFPSTDGWTFINHVLNCQHVDVCTDAVRKRGVEFVDGMLQVTDAKIMTGIREPPNKKRKPSAPTDSRINEAGGILLPPFAGYDLYPSAHLPLASASSPPDSSHPGSSCSLQRGPTMRPPEYYQSQIQSLPAATTDDTKRKYVRKTPYVYKSQKRGNASTPSAGQRQVLAPKDRDSSHEMLGTPARRPSTRRNPAFDQPNRLAIAVALIRVLCVGVQNDVIKHWDLVAHALGFKYSAKELQDRWKAQAKGHQGNEYSQRLQAALQEPFLEAYEAGKLPKVDFEDLQHTDWPALVRWAEAERASQDLEKPEKKADDVVKLDSLPDSRDALESRFCITSQASGTNQSQNAAKRPYSISILETKLERGTNSGIASQHPDLARSWLRAYIVTEYPDQEEVAQKFALLGGKSILEATQGLLDSGMLAKTKKVDQVRGKNYHVTAHALSQFARWPGRGKESKFLKGVAAERTRLVQHFEGHDEYQPLRDVSEAEGLVLTNMCAQGHLKVEMMLPERNDDFREPFPKLTKWPHGGFTHGNRKIDPSTFTFPFVYKKTPAFTSEHPLVGGVTPPMHTPAIDGETNLRIPFWVDIHDDLIPDIWDMVVHSVLHVLAFRSGSTVEEIEKAHKGFLWTWDIEMILEWMERVGVVRKLDSNDENQMQPSHGWTVSEWFYCLYLPEVAIW